MEHHKTKRHNVLYYNLKLGTVRFVQIFILFEH